MTSPPPGRFTPDYSSPEWCAWCGQHRARHVSASPGDPPDSCPATLRNVPAQGGSGSLTTAIFCGILAAVALIGVIISGHDSAVCNSDLGQLGQAVSTTTATDCATANDLHVIAEAALAVFALGCLIALMTHFNRRPPAPPAGPPPPPPPNAGP